MNEMKARFKNNLDNNIQNLAYKKSCPDNIFDNKMTKSPLNYIGAKFKLLPKLLPLFPKDIILGLDLFCGGGSVGINLNAKEIIFNDNLHELIRLYELFKNQSLESIMQEIDEIIKAFKLSQSFKFGYDFYHCNSTKGLSSYNKQGFLKLRHSYNKDKGNFDNLSHKDKIKLDIKLFVLIIFSFNNQIRFNSKGEFNLPCGKRDFNIKMQEKLRLFMRAMQTKNVSFTHKDFRDFKLDILDSKSFVYIDPPYFLATAPYNENKAWQESDEKDLLEFLRLLDSKKICFALSNVLVHKGKEHKLLKEWLKQNPKFNVHYLNFHYNNCNYQSKKGESCEVLVKNMR